MKDDLLPDRSLLLIGMVPIGSFLIPVKPAHTCRFGEEEILGSGRILGTRLPLACRVRLQTFPLL